MSDWAISVRIDEGDESFMFPELAVAYLRRHKPGQCLDHLCRRQVDRAVKQVGDLRPVLQTRPPVSVLDIGCGLGLVNVLLARQFGAREFYLVDGDGTGEKRADYASDVQPWNDVWAAAEIVRDNTPEGCRVHAYQPEDLEVPGQFPEVDTVVSFKSWGLHYPVAVYLPLVTRCLSAGGLLVMDIHDPEGHKEIEAAGFSVVARLDGDGASRSIIPFTRYAFVRG